MRRARQQDHYEVKLNDSEEQIKKLIEKEARGSKIYEVFEKIRAQIQGNVHHKNNILTRRFCEYYIKPPEKWTVQEHYQQKRNAPQYLTSIDPSRLLVFGTDFISRKKITNTIQKTFILPKPIIQRIDQSHQLIIFTDGKHAINFLQKTAKNNQARMIEKDGRGYAMTNQMSKSYWFQLWSYQYFGNQRNLEARFVLQGESFSPPPSYHLRSYEKAKNQILQRSQNHYFNGQNTIEEENFLSYGEKWRSKKAKLNKNLENSFMRRSYGTMQQICDPSRSRQKRTKHSIKKCSSGFNSPNVSFQMNDSYEIHGDDEAMNKKFQKMQNRKRGLFENRERNLNKIDESFENGDRFSLQNPRNQISAIESRNSFCQKNQQKSFERVYNLNEKERKKSKKKKKKNLDEKNLNQMNFSLADLSQFDESNEQNSQSSSHIIEKMSQNQELQDRQSNMSYDIPKDHQIANKTKQIDVSLIFDNQSNNQQKIQSQLYQNNREYLKRGELYENPGQKNHRRQLYQQKITQYQRNNHRNWKQNTNKKNWQHRRSYNFSYRDYFQKTKKEIIEEKAKSGEIIDLERQN